MGKSVTLRLRGQDQGSWYALRVPGATSPQKRAQGLPIMTIIIMQKGQIVLSLCIRNADLLSMVRSKICTRLKVFVLETFTLPKGQSLCQSKFMSRMKVNFCLNLNEMASFIPSLSNPTSMTLSSNCGQKLSALYVDKVQIWEHFV